MRVPNVLKLHEKFHTPVSIVFFCTEQLENSGTFVQDEVLEKQCKRDGESRAPPIHVNGIIELLYSKQKLLSGTSHVL